MRKDLFGLLIRIGLVLVVIRLVFAYWPEYPEYSWNQKVTVTVQTPDGVVTASSVGRTKVRKLVSLGLPEAGGVGSSFVGEATVVPLPNGKYLFALITDAAHANQRVFADEIGMKNRSSKAYVSWEKTAQLTQELKGAKAFPPEHYPMLVTFADIDDPTSVKKVDPNDLAATFGAGYSLKSITLEITNDPVTMGKAEGVLTWLNELNGGYLHGGFTSKGSPLGLHGGAFKTGHF